MSAQNKKNYKVTPFTANKEDIGKICSICGSGILNDESIVTCPECGLPYHHECWKCAKNNHHCILIGLIIL